MIFKYVLYLRTSTQRVFYISKLLSAGHFCRKKMNLFKSANVEYAPDCQALSNFAKILVFVSN